MAKTIIEKILSQKCHTEKVRPDDRLWIDLDLVTMRDFGGPNAIVEYNKEFSEPVFNPDKVAITFDVQVPAKLEENARNQKICRDFAKKEGIKKLFDVNQGIGQHVLYENGLISPGMTVIGTDSHMNLLGVTGCLAMGVGTTDIVGALRLGQIWLRVPHTVNVELTGTPRRTTTAKDVILTLISTVGEAGGLNRAYEFSGDYSQRIQFHEALTITSMITELGGLIGLFYNNPNVQNEIAKRTGKNTPFIAPDKNANYLDTVVIDVNKIPPVVACPHSPANVKPVTEVAGVPLDQVFIGSCTNGRFEDFRDAAKILKGHKVHSGTRLIVVPATTEVTRQCIEAGFFTIFLDAGAVLCNAGCSLCTTGHYGVLAPKETCLSTGNRNFVGKLGKGAEVYLGSPITAAQSAIKGEITVPE